MTFPATYELDRATGEATGIVHPYCSPACQARDTHDGPVSVEPDGGEDMGRDGCICETCGSDLDA